MKNLTESHLPALRIDRLPADFDSETVSALFRELLEDVPAAVGMYIFKWGEQSEAYTSYFTLLPPMEWVLDSLEHGLEHWGFTVSRVKISPVIDGESDIRHRIPKEIPEFPAKHTISQLRVERVTPADPSGDNYYCGYVLFFHIPKDESRFKGVAALRWAIESSPHEDDTGLSKGAASYLRHTKYDNSFNSLTFYDLKGLIKDLSPGLSDAQLETLIRPPEAARLSPHIRTDVHHIKSADLN